jgi:hypothetical protein
MQRTTSGAAGNGLYTRTKCQCGAAGIGVGTTPGFCSAGTNQLPNPASKTPRSYGRRHRSWHQDNLHATRKRETACTPQPSTLVAPWASAWAPRSSICDEQRAPLRTTA